VTSIGIAVHVRGLHIGVLYRVSENTSIRLLHLAWHQKLCSDEPSDAYKCWVRPAIGDDRAMAVAAFCRRIWKQNERSQIPYGFSNPNRFFDTSGDLIRGPAKVGLTCASFVLAVFEGAGVALADLDSWPEPTEDDIKRQTELLDTLKVREIDPDHIAAVSAELGNTRFHPLDVAGAGTADPLPSSYEHASKIGREISALLDAQ
jgi:hypothetical protein